MSEIQSVCVEGCVMIRVALNVKFHLENLGVDAKFVINWMLQVMWWEYAGWVHLNENGDQRRGVCEHGNETSVSTKGREFVDNLSYISF